MMLWYDFLGFPVKCQKQKCSDSNSVTAFLRKFDSGRKYQKSFINMFCEYFLIY
jgi:hypothetical protein